MKQLTPYPASSFTLLDSEGATRSLKDYAGQWLILYFYPKDDTPGCTIEACSFRDMHESLLAQEAAVVGVSQDDTASHVTFRQKYDLSFTLLSDPERKTIEAYGAWGKKMFGHEGILRKTFIIDPNGQVVKAYGRVTPLGHAEKVLADLKQLQAR
jgi:peroxiredoxin Q/BCP